ncbi:MAG: hypothetical protein IV088_18370 [Hydrogenophaga sp.]|uniref:hypothetical protein n=1 Tax=Hydrogenophaga sp. TaxID=1904254 RepID=UPI0025BD4E99|nr:hypothetical protein [Hydrogenophaga sp.]MBT9552820.1 hypothetical protein [Hydrogenophaga sp.]
MHHQTRPTTVRSPLDLGELSQLLHAIKGDPDFFDVFKAFADPAPSQATELWFQIDGTDLDVTEWLLDDDGLSPPPPGAGLAVHAQLRPFPCDEDRNTISLGLCFQDATLTLSRNGIARRDDRFIARSNGSLSALTEGQAVVVDGQVVGLVKRNSGGLCQLDFNARCTMDLMDTLLGQLDCLGPAALNLGDNAIGWTFCCFYLGRPEVPEEHIFMGCTQHPDTLRCPELSLELI